MNVAMRVMKAARRLAWSVIPGSLVLGGIAGFAQKTHSGDSAVYRNPILYADYSDPDVIRDGEDYYLTSSSFNCTPGLPNLHSRNMVN